MPTERAGKAGVGGPPPPTCPPHGDHRALVVTARDDPDPQVRELAFAELVARFHRSAITVAYALVGDAHLAEDVAQEAFAAAWCSLVALREPSAFPGWFHRIVASQAHRILRASARRESPVADAGADLGWTPGGVANGDDPVRHVEDRELRCLVRLALRALPESQRPVAALYYLGGQSVAEAAASLNITPFAVKNRLHAARRNLKSGDLQGVMNEPMGLRAVHEPQFVAEVERRLVPFRTDMEYYEARASGLVAAVRCGLAPAVDSVRRCGTRILDDADAWQAGFTLDQARSAIAIQHGFSNWKAFSKHVARLAAGTATEPFQQAYAAIERADAARLGGLLATHPELAAARGTNGNTLLHLAVGFQSPACAELLLRGRSGPNAPNHRGATPLHQAAYGNRPDLVDMLLDAGADGRDSAYGDGGTPLVWALFWGHVQAAESLARRGVWPANIRVAAGLGDIALLSTLFGSDGRPVPEAGAHRAFYRPHTGFPAWAPSVEPQEWLDEALTYAARNGRVEAMAFLLAHGARLDAEPYRGTPLVWAAATGRVAAVRWLLARGASVNLCSGFGGPDHGQGVTALHVAAEAGGLDVVRLLVEHGADLHLRDRLHGGDAAGWAAHGRSRGAKAVREYLQGLGAPHP